MPVTVRFRSRPLIACAAVLLILTLVYGSTLQTIPNGSQHYFMIDVGETQIVLNTWGTLHATGYPLYVMIGNAVVTILRALGVSPATAPAVVSLIWTLAALALIYALIHHLTRRAFLSAAVVLVFGLTRTVWIHAVIAEIYSMGLFLLALLLAIALWRGALPWRIVLLALVGGIGIGHHRALALAAPGLLYAVWNRFAARVRRQPLIIPALIALGLIGLLPYLYMFARGQTGAAWVYGDPGTLAGLWDQFIGREADRFIGSITTLDGWLANFRLVGGVLLDDLSIPGAIAGLIGLALGASSEGTRRVSITMILIGGAAFAFHVLFYSDVLSALILPISLSMAFGWLLLGEWMLRVTETRVFIPSSPAPFSLASGEKGRQVPLPVHVGEGQSDRRSHGVRGGLLLALPLIAFAAALIAHNQPFIHELTTEPTGLETIAAAERVPDGSTLMIPWGVHHFAVGFAKDVLNALPDFRLVDHNADHAALVQTGRMFTLADTLYNHPIDWWQERIGAPVYLRSTAPHVVEIGTQPQLAIVDARNRVDGVVALDYGLECAGDLTLRVDWHTPDAPERDLSVFVHILDANGTLIAQADQSAPVYGFRPLTTWRAREVVADTYPIALPPEAAAGGTVRFGLYEQLPDGAFQNAVEYSLPLRCD